MRGTHINPDHFLQTPSGRVITPELNVRAWEQSYEALDRALLESTPSTTVYVLIGAQGAGKSSWARDWVERDGHALIFDAIVVKKSEREPILQAARRHRVKSIAVWFRTPLDLCLARNAARPIDEVVPERGIRNVHAALEPPAINEGFDSIIEVAPNE